MTSLTWLRLREPIHHNPKNPPGWQKNQRKQTTTTTWTLFIKTALLSQPPKDCMAQLKAREDLSVLLGALLLLPYVSKDNHFVGLLYYAVPIPALASQGGSKQDLCRENEKRSSFVGSCADSAQCWLCITALSSYHPQRGSARLKIQ